MQTAMNNATRFLELAREEKIEPSMGFLLQMPPIMRDESYIQINDFCVRHGIEARSPAFFAALEKIISTTDIVEITPLKFVASLKKAETLSLYEKRKHTWGMHIPFFFQTRPDAVFYIFRTSSDALLAMMQMLSDSQAVYNNPATGNVHVMKVKEIFEHAMHLCYALCDLDDYPTRYQGRISEKEIHRLTGDFPKVCNNLLIQTEAIYPENVIEIKEKIRSRVDATTGIMKLSKHFILSLYGPKQAHRRAFTAAFQIPFNNEMSLEDWLKDIKKRAACSGNYASVPIECLTSDNSFASLLAYDFAAPPGGPNGISTFFSKKRHFDPAPRYGITESICLGKTVSFQLPPYSEPHEINSVHLTFQAKLHMLSDMSYTIPKGKMTFYSEELLFALKHLDTANTETEAKV